MIRPLSRCDRNGLYTSMEDSVRGAGFKKSDLEAMKKLPVDEKRAKLKEYFEYRKSQVGSAKAVNARHLNF